jgi:plasmid stabilization system protein ParE
VSLPVRVGEVAQAQLANAVLWYQANAPGQVARFQQQFASACDQVSLFPRLGHHVESGLRRVPMRVFPYQVWYTVTGDEVVVVACTHMRRDPRRNPAG